MKLANKIEAILFYKGEPISAKELARMCSASLQEIHDGMAELRTSLSERGIVLLEHDSEYALGTHGEMSDIISDLQKEELNKALSKASLEALAIILYKNGATRAEVDYIRGVNSGFTLRALAVRGLIEKTLDPNDARRTLYKPTLELLSYMGATSIEALPEFDILTQRLHSIQTEEPKAENEI
ncbi:MAG: SMC-Scp complex subunit ScpB [Candidatus Paceibacterota bacterium]